MPIPSYWKRTIEPPDVGLGIVITVHSLRDRAFAGVSTVLAGDMEVLKMGRERAAIGLMGDLETRS